MSFEEAVKKHKNNLIESLSRFHEGHRINGLLMDIDSNSSDYEYYFKAGTASRQGEVELLEKEIIETQEFLNNQNCIKQGEIDELNTRIKELELINFDSELHFDAAKEHIETLQNRIDKALSILSKMKHNGAYVAAYILKGQNNG